MTDYTKKPMTECTLPFEINDMEFIKKNQKNISGS